jgi:hypothetical protein
MKMSVLAVFLSLCAGLLGQSAPSKSAESQGKLSGTSSAGQSAASAPVSKVRVSMRNVDFHMSDEIIANIRNLDGELAPTGNSPPNFDDKSSFVIAVDSAQLSMSLESLTNDLNEWVFGSPDAPLKKLKVTSDGNKLKLSGSLASKAGVPFETQGTLVLAPDGMIRVHTTTIKTAHLPVKGLMDTFGVETSKVINTSHVKGVTIDKDDMVLDPEKALPPPVLKGHLTSVELKGQEILLTFGSAREAANGKATNSATTNGAVAVRNTCGGKSYIALKGGTVHFGKLTMDDADLQLVNMDLRDPNPFDFSMDRYKQQLVAGYSKITSTFGLCAFVPDAKKLGAQSKKSGANAAAKSAAPVGEKTPAEKH